MTLAVNGTLEACVLSILYQLYDVISPISVEPLIMLSM